MRVEIYFLTFILFFCPQVAVAPKEGAYVKDDFFDQLSCDTLERLHLQEEGGE